MTSSIYKRIADLESYIPQLDAAQTENADELYRMIGMLASSFNELVRRLDEVTKITAIAVCKFDDLIIDINEAMNDPL